MVTPIPVRTALPPIVQSHPLVSGQETTYGNVLLMGGAGERVVDALHPALSSFVRLAGGRRARIVVLVQTSTGQSRDYTGFSSTLQALGAKRVDVAELPASCTEQLNLGAAVPRATGFLFVGDDPKAMLAALADSVLLATVRSRHQDGAVIAGLGAGAAILGREVVCGPLDPRASEEMWHSAARKGMNQSWPGLKFLPGLVIDPSCGSHGNLERLLVTLAAHPSLMGLGLDPGAGVVVNATGQITSLGGGLALVVDGREATSDYAECRIGDVVSIAGARLHLLGKGKRFDAHAQFMPALLQTG